MLPKDSGRSILREVLLLVLLGHQVLLLGRQMLLLGRQVHLLLLSWHSLLIVLLALSAMHAMGQAEEFDLVELLEGKEFLEVQPMMLV